MRVLITTDVFPPICGGSGWSTYERARGLRARGLLFPFHWPEPFGRALVELVKRWYTIDVIRRARTDRNMRGPVMPGTVSPETVADQILWLRRGIPTTPLHIVKLVYLCHGWMLGLRGKPLINEPVVVGKYGPIVQSVYDRYKVFGSHPIPAALRNHSTDLDKEQRRIVEFVMKVYEDFKDTELSAITHQEDTPWSRSNESDGIGGTIPEEGIREHYQKMIQAIRAEADVR